MVQFTWCYNTPLKLFYSYLLLYAWLAYTKDKQTIVSVIVINVLRCIDRWCNGLVFKTRLTVCFAIQAPARSMSPPGRDARYMYLAARSLRLKTRLRLDQGARTAFLLIHAVLRLHTRKVHAELYTLLPRKCPQV